MEQTIRIYRFPNGEIQRIQSVRLSDWQQLEFYRPAPSDTALQRFGEIYRRYLVPACPGLFGNMVLVPDSAAPVLRAGVKLRNGRPVFDTEAARGLWQHLEQSGQLVLVRGKLPTTQIIPVGAFCGDLTQAPPVQLLVNASFFIMDKFDCATPYDRVGTPLGLLVKDGLVENPPLYDREALLVDRKGQVTVRPVTLGELTLEIRGRCYQPGKNAALYTRPERSRVYRGTKLVIVGNRVVDIRTDPVPVPASGFILVPQAPWGARPGDLVTYRGMEDVLFGIQVGNSILTDGVDTACFRSRFYNIRRLQPVPYPPSLYPMDFQRARAARIALGADREGRPVVLWAEGAAKTGHTPGVDSQGASLSEMPRYCRDAGMVQAVNLDGGGSAQLLYQGKRSLLLSDRTEQGEELERPVPLALQVT